MRFGMLRGPQILRAPENDLGSDPDDLDDELSLDEPTDDDDPEPEDEDDLDPDQDTEDDVDDDDPPARQSRGESRQAKLARERNELKERLDRQERELADLRAAQRPQTAGPVETPQQRQERLANMEPWERTEYLRQESEQAIAQRLANIEFQTQDSRDQLAYDALAARHPVADKLRKDVDAKLADLRKGGFNAPRKLILEQILGERQLSNAGRATNRAKKAADANRDRQGARPPAGRGDAEVGDRRQSSSQAARNKRVEGYQL